MVYKFFDIKSSNTNKQTNKQTGIIFGVVSEDKELAKELHKPIIRKFEKQKVHSHFVDNIWGADLA